MNKNYLTTTLALSIMLLAGCSDSSSPNSGGTGTTSTTGNGLTPDAALNITALPATANANQKLYFNRYSNYTTPSGGEIAIWAQNTITNEQIVRVRNVLGHFLSNYPGSEYGVDKSAVANQMADNQATIVLLNGSDDGTNPAANMLGQPLYKSEIQVEGGTWYTAQDYTHRDATFEEVLHLVHDYGIGVDGANTSPGPLKTSFQTEIRAAQVNAQSSAIWPADGNSSANWIAELSTENSLPQEYLASVIDSYYGLWGAWTESPDKGMWGLYAAKDRAAIAAADPMGQALVSNKFFLPYISYNARIDAAFTGEFSLSFDAAKPYTNTSRYLKDVTLLGSLPTGVRVNELDNNITGNSGNNTVRFNGAFAEYTYTTNGDVTTVTDNTANRDGVNTLKKIEGMLFTDQTVNLAN